MKPLLTQSSYEREVDLPPDQHGKPQEDLFERLVEHTTSTYVNTHTQINQTMLESTSVKPDNITAPKPYYHPERCPAPTKEYYEYFDKINEVLTVPEAFRGKVKYEIKLICNYLHRITKLINKYDTFTEHDRRYVIEMCVLIVKCLKHWHDECAPHVEEWEHVQEHFPKIPKKINYSHELPGLDVRTIVLFYRHNLPIVFWQYQEEYTVFREMSYFAVEHMWNPYAVRGRLEPCHARNKVHTMVRNVTDRLDEVCALFRRRFRLMDTVKIKYHAGIDLYRSLPSEYMKAISEHLEDLGKAMETPEESEDGKGPGADLDVPENKELPAPNRDKIGRYFPPPVKFAIDHYAIDRKERKRAERGEMESEHPPSHQAFNEPDWTAEAKPKTPSEGSISPGCSFRPSLQGEEGPITKAPLALREESWADYYFNAVFADNNEVAVPTNVFNRPRFPFSGPSSAGAASSGEASSMVQSPMEITPVPSPLRCKISAPRMSLVRFSKVVAEVSRSGGVRPIANLARLLRGISLRSSKGKGKFTDSRSSGDGSNDSSSGGTSNQAL